jgi:predicted permease
MVNTAIQSVLSLLILIGVGYVVAGQSWYPETGTSFLSKLSMRVAIPCHMFTSTIMTIKTPEALGSLVRNLPIPYLTIGSSLLLGLVLTRILKIDPRRRGVFINAISFTNTVLVGFVVVETIFGADAMPDAMVYYFGNTTLFWTVGVAMLRLDAEKARELADSAPGKGNYVIPVGAEPVVSPLTREANDRLSGSGSVAVSTCAATINARKPGAVAVRFFRSLLSPPLFAVALGIVVIMTRLQIPDFLMMPLMNLRSMTTPIAMIFTGAIIRGTDFKNLKVSRDLVLVLVTRFILTPVFLILILKPFAISTQMKQIFFLMATMPVMTQLGIMSRESGCDYEYASLLVTFTTAFSMLAIPFYLFVLERFQIF